MIHERYLVGDYWNDPYILGIALSALGEYGYTARVPIVKDFNFTIVSEPETTDPCALRTLDVVDDILMKHIRELELSNPLMLMDFQRDCACYLRKYEEKHKLSRLARSCNQR